MMRPTDSTLLAAQLAACCAFGASLAASAAAKPLDEVRERPNVLFINIDDLRTFAIGCYGSDVCQTPNVDALATRGMQFEHAYVQGPFCNPSRTSFLTGLRPNRTGVTDNHAHFRKRLPDLITLPQLFRESGYHTYRLGKIYHGAASHEDPKSWDEAIYPKITELGRMGSKRNMTGGKIPWCWWMAAEGDDEDQPDGQIARLAVEYLNREHDKPFFLAVGFHKPHDPFIAPKKYFDLYPLESLVVHRDPEDVSPTPAMQIGESWKQCFDVFTDRERREFLRCYYACTTFMDAQLGKVIAALDASPYANNTVIIALSDHGYHLGERGWWNKSTLYEWSTRSALWVYVPGMTAAAKRCDRLVEFLDIYPTLVELCRLSDPGHLQGRSFAPLLNDPTQPWKDAAFTYTRRGETFGRTIRTERYRYVEWTGRPSDSELFDHHNDPGEYHNLARDPAHADILAQLRERLHAEP